MNEPAELDDFGWEENKAYSNLICEGFTQDEIEALEVASDFYFPLLERTGHVTFSDNAPLQLEIVWQYEEGDRQ